MLSVLPLLVGFQLLLQALVIDIASVPAVSRSGPLALPPPPAESTVSARAARMPPGGRAEDRA
jgi:hypothetical protein